MSESAAEGAPSRRLGSSVPDDDRSLRGGPHRPIGPEARSATDPALDHGDELPEVAPGGRSLVARTRWTVELVRVLTPRELRSRYRQSVLDIAWALITPLSVLVVYGVVLTQSFEVSGNGTPYLSLAWSGLVLWTFFAGVLSGSASSLIYSADLITKVYFPKEALPLSIVGASMVDLGIGLCTVGVLVPAQGIPVGWTVVIAVVPIAILVLWSAALGIVLGVAATFVRDIPHVVTLFVRVGFFATPVMYDTATLPRSLRWSATVSPIAASIEGFRDAVLRKTVPDMGVLGVHLGLGCVLLVAAIAYTRSVESRLTDVV